MYLEQINIVYKSSDEWDLNLTGMLNGKVNARVSGTFNKIKTAGESN